ncbi:MAG TPA: ferritin-like domain-containing protein [Bryobacteraceae bacterium]|jgi:hypothetical protein|nr:ferritin-like domain-containing protein [Bryobacteraceae bacterium]
MDHVAGAITAPKTNHGRRKFFKGLGKMAAGGTAAMLFGELPVLRAQSTGASQDTANQIFLAALIAEDLATTFYYSGLVGKVVQDPNLAGPGGTATKPNPTNSNIPNLDYVRAALNQEIQHADLLRTVGNFGKDASTDPYQTFYFPAGTFDTLNNFIATLEALENAFIGAYLNAIREFASLASRSGERGVPNGPYGGPYSAAQLEYFAEVAGSILGVEAEHRVLGRVITNTPQANNLNYEQTDGLTSVYHGSSSAVAALTPFLNPNTGPAVSLSTALYDAKMIGLNSTGTIPPQ